MLWELIQEYLLLLPPELQVVAIIIVTQVLILPATKKLCFYFLLVTVDSVQTMFSRDEMLKCLNLSIGAIRLCKCTGLAEQRLATNLGS